MRKRPRSAQQLSAFTVMEALISLGLISLTLAILGSLFRSYARMMLHSGNRQKSMLGCQVATAAMRRDITSSISMQVTAATLTLKQMDPLLTSRLPWPLPTPLPGSWTPHDLADRVTLEYRLDGSAVVRSRSTPSLSQEEVVSDGVDGLEFRVLTNGNLEVVTSCNLDDLVQTWTVQIRPNFPAQVLPP